MTRPTPLVHWCSPPRAVARVVLTWPDIPHAKNTARDFTASPASAWDPRLPTAYGLIGTHGIARDFVTAWDKVMNLDRFDLAWAPVGGFGDSPSS